MQRSGRGPQGEVGQTSDNVWSTLRMAISFLHDTEAYNMVRGSVKNYRAVQGRGGHFGKFLNICQLVVGWWVVI